MIKKLEIEKHIRFIKLETFFASKSQGGGLRPSLNLSRGANVPLSPPVSAPAHCEFNLEA